MDSDALYYTPDRVDRWLRRWPELVALAESPRTAAHLAGPYREGPTPTDPYVGGAQGWRTDRLRWADVVADLEQAAGALTSGGPGPAAIHAAMNGTRPSAYAAKCQRRKADVLDLYRTCAEKMARRLGWASATDEGAAT